MEDLKESVNKLVKLAGDNVSKLSYETKVVGSVAVVATLFFKLYPIRYALRKQHRRPAFLTEAEALTGGGEYKDFLPHISVTVGKNNYPMIFQPATEEAKAYTNEELTAFVKKNVNWINEHLYIHGAILFRGFTKAMVTPRNFEDMAVICEPKMEEEYLGTSPRTLIEGCRYVHTASEIPGGAVIPNHCEMSFLPNPPKKIFFFAENANKSPGGETPLIDYRKVLLDIDPAVLSRWKQKKVRYARTYFDDKDGGPKGLLESKSWQAMFSTKDPAQVDAKCQEKGFEAKWENPESKRGQVKLTHTLGATRNHPVTGEEIWHNHHNVLHKTAMSAEFAFSAQHLQSWKNVLMHYWVGFIIWTQTTLKGDEDGAGMHTSHEGGEEMLASDVNHIRQMIWKHTIIYRHQTGDMAYIDNSRIGHGRQPFYGPRRILVTWA